MAKLGIMKAAAALFGLALGAFAEIAKDNGVLVLTDSNFEEALSLYPNGLLVEMYAPWCGHCKQLAPEYEKAAKELEPQGLFIAKLDATEHKEAASLYQIQGFPTIKYIVNGRDIDYNGGRTAEDIVKYVVKKSGPAVITLDSVKSLTDFTASSNIVVVGFFTNADSAVTKTFNDVASAMDDFLFGMVADEKLAETSEVRPNTIVIYKNFDERKSELPVTEATTADEISTFVHVYSMHLVTRFSPETAQSIFGGAINVHALFFTDILEGDLLNFAEEAARLNRGKLLHVHIDNEEKRVSEYFGVKEEDFPTMIIADMQQGVKKYMFGKVPLTKENIFKFEEDFFAGKLLPTLKSETPEDADLSKSVKIVKGKSFESIVLDNEDNVFVMFHAPWCGHCNALSPKWDELGDSLAGKERIVVGKMDATANEVDVPGVDIQSFPTLIFFPAGEKGTPITYEGEREIDNLMQFIDENAKFPATKTTSKDEL
jgi:protein disulfide-isomerase A1